MISFNIYIYIFKVKVTAAGDPGHGGDIRFFLKNPLIDPKIVWVDNIN